MYMYMHNAYKVVQVKVTFLHGINCSRIARGQYGAHQISARALYVLTITVGYSCKQTNNGGKAITWLSSKSIKEETVTMKTNHQILTICIYSQRLYLIYDSPEMLAVHPVHP